jgi:hypothetical protein
VAPVSLKKKVRTVDRSVEKDEWSTGR